MTTRLRTTPFDPAAYLRSEEATAVVLANAFDPGETIARGLSCLELGDRQPSHHASKV